MVSPPFGGLKKCLFSGKRRTLCRPDAREWKTYGRRPSGWLWKGKHQVFNSFRGSFEIETKQYIWAIKNTIGQNQWCLNFLKNRQIKFNSSLLKLVINGTMVSLKTEVKF